MRNRPSWYTDEHDSSWERMKTAFRRDWEQTRHDFGSNTARDLDQDVDDTIKQAAGSERSFEDHEPAFRFGHAARSHYGSRHATWNSDLENDLRKDYGSDWDRDRDHIRRAYEYRWDSTGLTSEGDRPGTFR